MIPKVIHYCWFGGAEKPALAKKCIESWRRFLPVYEIKEWNEANYDVHKIPYTSQAYNNRKYAFVSDYARFDILYTYGGLYFDTDVEIIKPLDEILEQGAFMGMEKDPDFKLRSPSAINPGLGLAVAPGLGLYKEILELYKGLLFLNEDGSMNQTTVVTYITNFLLKKGWNPVLGINNFQGIKIYPSSYFNPKRMTGEIVLTPNTYTIHHFAASWYSPKQRIVQWIVHHIGVFPARVIGLFLRNPFKIPRRVWDFLKGRG